MGEIKKQKTEERQINAIELKEEKNKSKVSVLKEEYVRPLPRREPVALVSSISEADNG